jgi:hypothetical protein
MIKFSAPSFILMLFAMACAPKDPYQPEKYFSKEVQDSIIGQTVYYSAKLAPHASHETKFDPEFVWYYKTAKTECDFRRCFPTPDGGYFFLMTRKARSIWPAREAIGGTFKLDEQDKLTDYNEVFRTWKMTEDSLNQRGYELFDLMVKGKDLTPFRGKYKGDRYIEFPDDHYYFNAKEKRWKDSLNLE